MNTKSKTGMIAACLLAVVVLLAAGGFFFYNQAQQRKEAKAWSDIEDSYDLDAINKFIADFPDGEHRSAATERLDYVQTEVDRWQALSTSSDTTALAQFIAQYSEGPYHNRAVEKLKELQEELYNNLHDPAMLEQLMKEMAAVYNRDHGPWKMIQQYGTTQFSSTYISRLKNCGQANTLYLLQTPYSTGYDSIGCNGVENIEDNTCNMKFSLYNTEGGERALYDRAVFKMVLEDGKWVIGDIVEDGHSFMNGDPSHFVGFVP